MFDNQFIELDGERNPEMFNNMDIQNAYVTLYKELRRYIWGFDIVDAIAELEVASYRTCPDIDEVRGKYNQLEYLVKYVAEDDERLQKAMNDFNDVINSGETTYAILRKVNEVI